MGVKSFRSCAIVGLLASNPKPSLGHSKVSGISSRADPSLSSGTILKLFWGCSFFASTCRSWSRRVFPLRYQPKPSQAVTQSPVTLPHTLFYVTSKTGRFEGDEMDERKMETPIAQKVCKEACQRNANVRPMAATSREPS